MKPFTEHPASVGESYFEHMRASFSFGSTMFIASIGCFVHGIFPFLCVTTGSRTVTNLKQRMVTHRNKNEPACHSSDQAMVSGTKDA